MAEKLIKINGAPLMRVAEALSEYPQVVQKAVASAINKTITSTNVQIKKEVAAEYAVKQKDVAKVLKVTKARTKSLYGATSATGYQIPLVKFKHTPVEPPPKQIYRKQVTATVKKGSKQIIKKYGNKAFVNKVKWTSKRNASSGKSTQILVRKGKDRFPIEKLWSVSIAQMISDKDGKKASIKRIKAKAQTMLSKKAEQEITYRINRINQKASKGGK